MKDKILVTGGAGFIGSHIVDQLLAKGYEVRIFDNLEQRVHHGRRPAYLNPDAEFIQGDIRDYQALEKAMEGIDIIFHKAAAVGVGISMYDMVHFTEINATGTANLLDIVVRRKKDIKKIIVASSASVYGEMSYNCPKCGIVYPDMRSIVQLEKGLWEQVCPICGGVTNWAKTGEDKKKEPVSIYGIGKRDQEEMVMVIGKTFQIPVVAFRYMGVYGERQSLSNPYTGVAPIFIARYLMDSPPLLYEDGLQIRDFIYVKDIAEINLLALANDNIEYECFNVGSGRPLRLVDFAKIIGRNLGKDIEPEFYKTFRRGDVRHIVAENSNARKLLGWKPRTPFEEGCKNLIDWIRNIDKKELEDFILENRIAKEEADLKKLRI